MRKFTAILSLLIAMVSTANADEIQVSTSTDRPEYTYTIKNGADTPLYANSQTAPTITAANYGTFAFFAVDGVADAYYIYSVKAKKYLSYNKADSYSTGKDFVTVADDRENYFKITKCSGTYSSYYELRPYRNDGNAEVLYLNWYGSVDNNPEHYSYDNGTIGLWSSSGNDDNGSRFLFTKLDYSPYTTGTRGGSYPNRFILNIEISGNDLSINDTEKTQYYVDRTETTIVVATGETVKANLTTKEATWMHSYIYIDKDNNGFNASLESDNCTPIGDLVSHSAYSADNSSFKNSKGESVEPGNVLNKIPEFTVPEMPGIYRMRYKMDYNDINPKGDDSFRSNSGFIVDFMLEVRAVPQRTVTVTTETEGCVVKANGNEGSVTSEGAITLTAEPAFGYEIAGWKLDGKTVSTKTTFIDRTDGNKAYTAVFKRISPEEQYATIAKPTFTNQGNITNITSATISNGNGIPDYSDNIIPAEYRPTNKSNQERQQRGQTAFIPIAPGATFDLNIKYNAAWGDITLVQIENGNKNKIYGLYEGSWFAAPNDVNRVYTYIEDSGISVETINGDADNEKVVKFPISISDEQKDGDIIIVRSVVANDYNISQNSYNEGSYIDFCFVIGGHDLTVSSAGYATMYLDMNTIVPEDAETYIVKKCNKTMAFLEQVTGILPKGTGVIVKAEPGTYCYQYTIEDATPIASNLLEGTVQGTYINGKAYVLGLSSEGEVGFYNALLNKDGQGNSGDTHFLNNANKAYLPASAIPAEAQQSAGFRFNFGGTTDIEDTMAEERESNEIYDLQGRMIKEITAPGIYIVNGKKRIVR